MLSAIIKSQYLVLWVLLGSCVRSKIKSHVCPSAFQMAAVGGLVSETTFHYMLRCSILFTSQAYKFYNIYIYIHHHFVNLFWYVFLCNNLCRYSFVFLNTQPNPKSLVGFRSLLPREIPEISVNDCTPQSSVFCYADGLADVVAVAPFQYVINPAGGRSTSFATLGNHAK